MKLLQQKLLNLIPGPTKVELIWPMARTIPGIVQGIIEESCIDPGISCLSVSIGSCNFIGGYRIFPKGPQGPCRPNNNNNNIIIIIIISDIGGRTPGTPISYP